MKKKMLYTALATLLMCSTANAVEITIDDFSTNQGPINDLVVNATPVTSLIALAGLKVTDRELSDNLLSANPPISNEVQVSSGILDVTNGTGEDSQVKVTWTLTPGVFTVPLGTITDAGFRFRVVESDANPTNISLAIGATALGNFAIPGNAVNQVLNFALSTALVDEVNAGGKLALTIDGTPGWDLSLNQLSLTYNERQQVVPEPGTISLLGIGLLGLGWRRWRQAESTN